MPQFRITQKFSKDLKIKTLEEPSSNLSFLDDWFIDVIRIDRKKVAFITHANTLLSFLIPYSHVGGASKVALAIKDKLIKFIFDNKFPQYQEQIEAIFVKDTLYCKTKDRSVLGHMNDFKVFIEGYTYKVPFDKIDWDAMMVQLNNTLAGDSKGGYNRPIDLMLDFLRRSVKSPYDASNVIMFPKKVK
ncbi:DUF6933 domain-containing protein [Candidatus Berkiella aquae]|uniref:DUF6933 domain-containing protein n=1 Tax=Candidatus Berkiella aquae TaxID=295108 RepID=A0A0Q9YT54_9GAMM|nr:hypothetical protein [Candidatus Berkiella aquae]MCS5712919.1 hypothetical protein [Candidatus Berkiella aquae]